MKNTLLIILVFTFFSCKKENKCIEVFKDIATFKEYVVVKDTCNVFENNTHESYFINDTIVMEGYGDRFIKEGEWEYYIKGKSVTKGKFENSNPIGVWEYKDFGKVEWEILSQKSDQYQLSLPKSWGKFKLQNNSIHIANDTAFTRLNIKIEVEVKEATITIHNIIEEFKNDDDFKFKKWENLDKVNSYLFENKLLYNGVVFNVSSLYFEFNNKIYSITFYIREKTNPSYEIIKEQIIRSFRIKIIQKKTK